MKRLAITLSVCLALVGWAATGHAKRGGGSKTAAPAAGDSAGGEGGEKVEDLRPFDPDEFVDALFEPPEHSN